MAWLGFSLVGGPAGCAAIRAQEAMMERVHGRVSAATDPSLPTQAVEMEEMHRQIGDLTGVPDPFAKQPVEYPTTGKSDYDSFFKLAAEVRGGLVVSETLSETLTTNLKRFARSYAAARATDEAVRLIVGDTSLDQLSEAQSVALLALKKKRRELSQEEATFAGSSVANTGQMVIYLNRTADTARGLTDQGTSLSKSVKEDFAGDDMVKAPKVARGLSRSLEHLREASVKAPQIAKTLTRLGESLRALL
jgi:hypothetical protein